MPDLRSAAKVTAAIDRLFPFPRGWEHEICLSIAGQMVQFRSDVRSGITIVETILGPYCDVVLPAGPSGVGAARGVWAVDTVSQPGYAERTAELREVLARDNRQPRPVRRWPGDDEALRYDLCAGECVVVHDLPFRGLTFFSRDERRIRYVRPSAELDVRHTEHVAKYPLRVQLREAGFSQAHAAACRYQGSGMLFIGQKGRGKSTLLVQAMGHGAQQVGNDMGYIRPLPDGGCEMVAFPHMTRLASGTINDSQRVRAVLGSIQRTGDYLSSPVLVGGKEEIYYPTLKRIWGPAPVCRRTSLDLIVFPHFDIHRGTASAVPLGQDEAGQRLRHHLMTDSPLPDWLPFHAEDELDQIATHTTERLIANAPRACELHFGPSATNPIGALERVLAELPQADRTPSAGDAPRLR